MDLEPEATPTSGREPKPMPTTDHLPVEISAPELVPEAMFRPLCFHLPGLSSSSWVDGSPLLFDLKLHCGSFPPWLYHDPLSLWHYRGPSTPWLHHGLPGLWLHLGSQSLQFHQGSSILQLHLGPHSHCLLLLSPQLCLGSMFIQLFLGLLPTGLLFPWLHPGKHL